jgi:hypothetical protein
MWFPDAARKIKVQSTNNKSVYEICKENSITWRVRALNSAHGSYGRTGTRTIYTGQYFDPAYFHIAYVMGISCKTFTERDSSLHIFVEIDTQSYKISEYFCLRCTEYFVHIYRHNQATDVTGAFHQVLSSNSVANCSCRFYTRTSRLTSQ